MSAKASVSLSVIRRLPRYYRFLGELLTSGTNRISSRELSEKMGVTASQIRQDLNCFGGFGQQGYGYNVASLRDEIANILGLTRQQNIIMIGVGNLGSAIVSYLKFENCGFHLSGLFDNNPDIIGNHMKGLVIRNVDELIEFCNTHKPTAAILCIPRAAAEEFSGQLVRCGIRAFWNFSHYDFTLYYDDIIVENVHLTDSLMTLGYRLNASLRERSE